MYISFFLPTSKFLFYTMNNVLTINIIIFFHYYYKSKRLECQEEILKKIIKIKEQEEIVNVDDDKENFNE